MSEVGTPQRCEHCFGALEHGECPACAPRLQRRNVARIADALEAIARAFEQPAPGTAAGAPMFCPHGAATTGLFEGAPISQHCRSCMSDPRLREAIARFERMSQDITGVPPGFLAGRPGR